jgi:hypothetical protein
MPRPPHPNLPREPFQVDSEGTTILSRASTRSASLRSPSRGLRIPQGLPDDMVTRAQAVALASRDDAVLWGSTAAVLLHLPVPYRLEAANVHVLVPEGRPRPRRRGVRARQADITPDEIVTVDQLSVTSPARTYADLAGLLGVPDLVAVGDVVLRDHRVSHEALLALVERRVRYTGKVRARETINLLNPRSRSPQESRLRAHVHGAGLPRPEVNGVITDDHGGFLACCDLVFRRQRVVVEYDGAVHDAPARRRSDATRRTLLREHGWYVVEVVDTDLQVPSRAIAKIRTALHR